MEDNISYGCILAAVNGDFCIGGKQPPGIFSNNEKYETANNKRTVEISMPNARQRLAATSFSDKIYVICDGPQPGGSSNVIYSSLPHLLSIGLAEAVMDEGASDYCISES